MNPTRDRTPLPREGAEVRPLLGFVNLDAMSIVSGFRRRATVVQRPTVLVGVR